MQLLDVDRGAGEATIKKAFKKAALKQHPDKVPAEEREAAEAKFKLVAEAHDMLTVRLRLAGCAHQVVADYAL